ncbi:MAG: hypothetical protein R6U11_04130, partial [Bacteroidales bacterium]
YGSGYKYAHDYKNAFAAQDHLPEKLKDTLFYLAEIYKDVSPTIYIALTKSPLTLKGTTVQLLIDNPIQQEEIREKRMELHSYLRKQLNNYSVKISTEIKENNNNNNVKKAYLPEEKISLMIEKKPEVKKLLDDLDLEMML